MPMYLATAVEPWPIGFVACHCQLLASAVARLRQRHVFGTLLLGDVGEYVGESDGAAGPARDVVGGSHGRRTSRMSGELASGRPKAKCDQSSPHCRKLLDSFPPACLLHMNPSRASCPEWSLACK